MLCGFESSSSSDSELPCAALLLQHISPPVTSSSPPLHDADGVPSPEGVLELSQQETEWEEWADSTPLPEGALELAQQEVEWEEWCTGADLISPLGSAPLLMLPMELPAALAPPPPSPLCCPLFARHVCLSWRWGRLRQSKTRARDSCARLGMWSSMVL